MGAPEAFYWHAFCDLAAFRGGELQPQPISLPDITAYCELHRIRSMNIRENIFDTVRLLEPEVRELRKEKPDA